MVIFQLRGVSGEEQVSINVGGVDQSTVTLTQDWQTFSFDMPTNRQWSINFLNDASGKNVYYKSDALTTVYHHKFDVWQCGQQGENSRCRHVRDGKMFWGGEYTYTLQTLTNCSADTVLASTCATITSPAEIVGDVVTIPNGVGNSGSARIDFTITCDANPSALFVHAEVLAPSGSDNSYFISLDGSQRKTWHTRQTKVFLFDDLPTYAISQGTHTLSFLQREDGISLRRVSIFSSGCSFAPQSNNRRRRLLDGDSNSKLSASEQSARKL